MTPGAESRLLDLWNREDSRVFGGRLRRHRPKIVFAAPDRDASCGTFTIRPDGQPPIVKIDETILLGRVPGTGLTVRGQGAWRLVEDTLRHEMCHVAAHATRRPWCDNEAHRGAFAGFARHYGQQLGLQPPQDNDWSSWPYSCRPAGYYTPES